MNEVPHDGKTPGEVVVRAPWLTQGYFKDPENSEALWRGGYLHTNDVANIDPRGYLKICDRTKDAIKTGGEWISSLLIEDIINQHPSVSETAVIGVPDEKWGERPMAIVVTKQGAGYHGLEQHIIDMVTSHASDGVIPRWGIPDVVIFVDALDKTSVGKHDKKLLRTKYIPVPQRGATPEVTQ
jgi:fatty-acyl-CoA synthase